MKKRLPALDWMRGIAMVLMATDHSSRAFNADRPVTDSVLLYDPKVHLDTLEFAYRWVSHLCAPTFLFLAGTALALSIRRKTERGSSPWSIDRDLLIRGLLILSVDLLFINWFWDPGLFILQVMYAIGMAMILMIPLRRLPAPLLVVLALGTIAAAELFLNPQPVVPADPLPVAQTALMSLGVIDTPLTPIAVIYPVLPWWAMMALGWAFGRFILHKPDKVSSLLTPAKLMLASGSIGLLAFVVMRWLNGFGNSELLRLDNSWVQWLHVSKYPPSAAFAALELGLMALLLAGLFRLQNLLGDRVRANGPLLVFGQTAFFFYIAHIFILEVAARSLGMLMQRGLIEAVMAAIVVTIALYPLCLWYRRYKDEHPRSFVRFI